MISICIIQIGVLFILFIQSLIGVLCNTIADHDIIIFQIVIFQIAKIIRLLLLYNAPNCYYYNVLSGYDKCLSLENRK